MGNGSGSCQVLEDLGTAIKRDDTPALRDLLSRIESVRQPPSRDSRRAERANVDHRTLRALTDVDLNTPLAEGKTILQLAANCGRAEAIRHLLASPLVNVDVRDERNASALHCAVAAATPPRCTECALTLLDRQADPYAASSAGATPLDCARRARCLPCVQVLEERAQVWKGWIDHEERVLMFPSWRAKWLVILQDRRPNTGPAHNTTSSVACFRCGRVLRLPHFAKQVTCGTCGSDNAVAVSLQLAIYAPSVDGLAVPGDPSTARPRPPLSEPAECIHLPQNAQQMEVKALEDASFRSATDLLLQGKIRRGLQSTVSSHRRYGVSIKVKEATGRVLVEHSIRVDSAEERERLLRILSDPVAAAYHAACVAPAVRDQVIGSVATAVAIPPLPTPSAPPLTSAETDVRDATSIDPPVEPPVRTRWACNRCTFVHVDASSVVHECSMCGWPRDVEFLSPPADSDTPVFEADPNAAVAESAMLPMAAIAQDAQSNTDEGAVEAPAAATLVAGVPATSSWRRFANRQEGGDGYQLGDLTRGLISGISSRLAIGASAATVDIADGSSNASEAAHVSIPTSTAVDMSSPALVSASAEATVSNQRDDNDSCVVCLESPADSAVIPCGHMCGCQSCLQSIKSSREALCPICRGPVSSVIRIFRS
eukprot:TRINITY_DN56872_c0_g1_i1.p1 TRINITY_DN56872_c0_g1~~TRINITY_DN56872_c0_g1_i1.p1  ORF type:complete len:656 (+),score=39.55 TRINITY_DN56872_c0_g1_i1:42-2009(+)